MGMTYKKLNICFIGILTAWTSASFARKGNQQAYQDPYDIAAGGASLTRASRAGRIFSNPALLPYGGVFSLWLGSTTTASVNDGICELATLPCAGSGATSSGSNPAATDSAGDGGEAEMLKAAFKNPFRLGVAQNFAWITSHVGFSIFSRNEVDLRAKEIGPAGVPEVSVGVENYSGAQLAFAMRSPVRWFSLGAAIKMISSAEPEVSAGLEIIDNPSSIQQEITDAIAPELIVDADIGTLLFFQGKSMDFSFAGKVDDAFDRQFCRPISMPSGLLPSQAADVTTEEEAGTEASADPAVTSAQAPCKSGGSEYTRSFRQVISAGSGFTLHTGADQIHLSLDYRDIQNIYQEPLFKRIYGGAKVTLRQYLGFAAGIHHGYLSAGVEVNLLLVQLSASTYSRELSDKPGLDPRRYYVLSFSIGG